MSTGPKPDNRGGARPNSGPKRETLSVRQIREMQEAAEKRAKNEGRSLFDVILDIAYDKTAPRKEILAASKLYLDKMMIQASEGGDADRALGPAIFLPEKRPDPAKVIPLKKSE